MLTELERNMGDERTVVDGSFPCLLLCYSARSVAPMDIMQRV